MSRVPTVSAIWTASPVGDEPRRTSPPAPRTYPRTARAAVSIGRLRETSSDSASSVGIPRPARSSRSSAESSRTVSASARSRSSLTRARMCQRLSARTLCSIEPARHELEERERSSTRGQARPRRRARRTPRIAIAISSRHVAVGRLGIDVGLDLGAADAGEPLERAVAGVGRETHRLVERGERRVGIAGFAERQAEVVQRPARSAPSGGPTEGSARERSTVAGKSPRRDARRPAFARRAAALRPISSERSSAGPSCVRYA